jgi:hypothetical protein
LEQENIMASLVLPNVPSNLLERLERRAEGLDAEIARPSSRRGFEFDVERVTFALALQRRCAPGSDLSGSSWVHTTECAGFEAIELQHMYRAVGWLAKVRDELEKDLFLKDRDLFSQKLDLVVIDVWG